MAFVLEQLLAALNDLETDELKRFKLHLKSYYSVSAADLENADAPDTVDLMMKRFGPEEAVKITVDILRKMNYNHLAEELENKHKQVTSTNIDLWTRDDFLQYSHQLTLDLNTVNKRLCLSESNRIITYTYTDQPYPDHPDRFDEYAQVLCRESVSGRCYWEIEWRGDVSISVSYKSISRKGEGYECLFGYNDQSWSLDCTHSAYYFRHNKIKTDLPVKPIISKVNGDDDDFGVYRVGPNGVYRVGENGFYRVGMYDVYRVGVYDVYRVGVYVDHGAGTLSFYSVSDTMSLIHTEHTTFTQTLYPGFWVCSGSSLSLC